MGANAVTTVPVYVSGEVLTAADMNITNSGIPVFATTTTRDAAFGGTGEKTLAEGQFAYIEATNTTQYYDGAAWQSVTPPLQIAIFNETQAQGTAGGSSTTSFKKRVLNTTVGNNIAGCSISSSVVTLATAGTYYFRGFANAYNATSVKSKIRNTTDSTDTGIGLNVNLGNEAAGSPTQTASLVECIITITASTDFELQSREGSAVAVNGLGANLGAGVSEVYSFLYIQRIA